MSGTPKYTETERAQIKARILEILARGPASTAELAARFGITPRKLSWFLGQMMKDHQIARFGRDGNSRIWRSLGAPAPKITIAAAKTAQRCIDEEHKQWQAYWSLPKAERLRLRLEQQQ